MTRLFVRLVFLFGVALLGYVVGAVVQGENDKRYFAARAGEKR